MKPHLHKYIIKRWAGGATVEYYSPIDNKWRVITKPKWLLDVKYRIQEPERHTQYTAIVNWAEGKELQVRSKITDEGWIDLASVTENGRTPTWSDLLEYRVKPELRIARFYEHKNESGDVQISCFMYNGKRCPSWSNAFIRWLSPITEIEFYD